MLAPGSPGIGFNLTSDGNYDMVNKKLANVAEGTASRDAITKNQLDTAIGNKHGNDQNIDLKDTYNVIKSKQQTFNEVNANRNTLVCYEDVRGVFVSRKESVFPMATHLDMGTNYIYNVKTPINNDQGVNKSYADTKLSLSGGLMTGNLDMITIGYIMELNQIVIINQVQKYGQKVNFWISPVEVWQGLLICPIIKLLILQIPQPMGTL